MKKLLVILIFTILGVGSFYTPAFGANMAVTTGIAPAPYMLEGEFEFCITDNSTICIRSGSGILLPFVIGVLTGTGVGYRWYYSGEALDGFYLGGYADYLQWEGTFMGFSPVSGSIIACQGVWGYKKVLGNWFVFDLGVTAYAGETDKGFSVLPGVIATIGVAW